MQESKVPVNIVGSTKFGRYDKISSEQTYNMIISDEWLVPYAGYKKAIDIDSGGAGRGIYHSTKFKHLILIINNGIYIVNESIQLNRVGSIDTYTGDVFMAENDANQIAICDKQNIYIYNYVTNTVSKAFTTGQSDLDFAPGYMTFQDGYFICPDLNQSQWRLSKPNDGREWPATANNVGAFQTKADNPIAAISAPGKGGNLFIMGSSVTELWNNVGAKLFPYQRASGFNIDYGCISSTTIASGDNFVIWLGINEKSGPVIMYSSGGEVTQISTDGINFRLAQLVNPQSSYGFLFKQDGHLFYHITFSDDRDNFTLTYDFNTGKFFSLCDASMNKHIAKRVAAFNNTYYFISFIDGNLYELNSNYSTYDGEEFPRTRVCGTTRADDNAQFIADQLEVLMEQGKADNMAVDVSLSRDGGVTFGNYVRMRLNKITYRKNKFILWGLGSANELTIQFRFYGTDRFVVSNGLLTVRQ